LPVAHIRSGNVIFESVIKTKSTYLGIPICFQASGKTATGKSHKICRLFTVSSCKSVLYSPLYLPCPVLSNLHDYMKNEAIKIFQKRKKIILENWIKYQLSDETLREDLISNEDLRAQSDELLNSFEKIYRIKVSMM